MTWLQVDNKLQTSLCIHAIWLVPLSFSHLLVSFLTCCMQNYIILASRLQLIRLVLFLHDQGPFSHWAHLPRHYSLIHMLLQTLKTHTMNMILKLCLKVRKKNIIIMKKSFIYSFCAQPFQTFQLSYHSM